MPKFQVIVWKLCTYVYQDVHGEALAPVTFGGVYLPLEIEAGECSRSPLVLAYDAAHFSALVAMRKTPLNRESTENPPTGTDHQSHKLCLSLLSSINRLALKIKNKRARRGGNCY